jgi:hypothetical protein
MIAALRERAQAMRTDWRKKDLREAALTHHGLRQRWNQSESFVELKQRRKAPVKNHNIKQSAEVRRKG